MVRTACRPGLHAEACALTVATQIGVRPRPRQTFFDGRAVWGPGEPSRRPVIGSTMILGLAQIATDRLPLVPDVLRRNRYGPADVDRRRRRRDRRVAGRPRCDRTAPAVVDRVLRRRGNRRGRCARTQTPDPCTGRARARNDRRRHPAYAAPATFSIVAFDLGQGDGIVIRTPRVHTLLGDVQRSGRELLCRTRSRAQRDQTDGEAALLVQADLVGDVPRPLRARLPNDAE
jgi:hypothetical protein